MRSMVRGNPDFPPANRSNEGALQDKAESGENHCISRDHILERSVILTAVPPLNEEWRSFEISISTSWDMVQGRLDDNVLDGCPERNRASLKCGGTIRGRFQWLGSTSRATRAPARGLGPNQRERKGVGIAALSPDSGPWQRLESHEILPLANGESGKIEILADGKTWLLGRIDGIKALAKVPEKDVERAYDSLVDALEDDFPDVRIAALKTLPSFSLRRQGILLHCLSDRLQDDEDSVREEAMTCLKKVAPLFPSGCEEILRRELRDTRKDHRGNAFEALKLASREWPEVGCLHLDELIREEEDDLRIRGSMILRR